MPKRLGMHIVLCIIWTGLAVLIIPFSWVAMNDLFWWAGIGPVLTERPVAAVHHRMMGTWQEFENQGDRMSYLRGHLRVYPDSAERATWQQQLDQVQSDRTWLLVKVVAVFAVLYIPIGLFIEGFRRRGPDIDMQEEPFAPY